MDGESIIASAESNKSKRGGARPGAGRKKMTHPQRQRWMQARGINPLTAAEILATVADERRIWKRLLESEDDRVVLQAMQFLVSMRDGRPAQQINVTSTSITLNASEIERARQIVAEIRGERPGLVRANGNSLELEGEIGRG